MSLFSRRLVAYIIDIVFLFAILGSGGVLLLSLLQFRPQTNLELSLVIVINFSLPVWLYLIASDASIRGATLGKRLMGLRVSANISERLGVWQSILRTAIKLLPWELVHLSAFALSADLEGFTALQVTGVVLSNLIVVANLTTAAATGGRRSLHDFVARTHVQPS